MVIVTLSGGGTRAAAFGYGVLRQMRDTPIGSGVSLLDQTDVISSVSGGSFVAAFYGLFGRDEFFSRFESEVLHRQIETALAFRLVAPWNWPWLARDDYSRGLLAADYYSQELFEGRTFAEMPHRRPFIMINGTDLGLGRRFSFVQHTFDRICSDLDSLPVGYAVFASSAVPVLFPPLTLRNYAGDATCPSPPVSNPPVIDLDEADWARAGHADEHARTRPYLQISDGGLADNLGVTAIDGGFLLPSEVDDPFDRPVGLASLLKDHLVENLLVIIVDARTGVQAGIDDSESPPSLFSVLLPSIGAPMGNVSDGTITKVRRQVQAAEKAEFRILTGKCSAEDETCNNEKLAALSSAKVYVVHLSLDLIRDKALRESLQDVGTRLQLDQAPVGELIDWAGRLLRESQDYTNAVSSMRLPSAGR